MREIGAAAGYMGSEKGGKKHPTNWATDNVIIAWPKTNTTSSKD